MLHVTFGRSECGSVIQAMRMLGQPENVTYVFDDFSIGPLCDDFNVRATWFDELDIAGQFRDLAEENTRAFAEILVADEITIWMSRFNAQERCGFLEIVRRRDGAIHVIDIANHDMRTGIPPHDHNVHISFGGTGPDRIIETKLHEAAVPIHHDARANAHVEWNRLAAEHSFLRVVESDRLLPVPFTYFDDFIASFVQPHWKSHSFVVGSAIAYGYDEGKRIHPELAWDRVL